MKLSKLAALPVFLLLLIVFALPSYAAFEKPVGDGDHRYDLGAPDPENYPYFTKQIPVAFYDPNDVRVDEDGNCYLDEVSWGWLHTYTNDETGSIKDGNRLGLTISFLMRSELPESAFANTTKAEVWIPSRAAPPFGAVIQAFGHQTKLFKLPELIAQYNNKMAFNSWTRGQVEGTYLPSDSAMLIQANIPDKTTMLAATNGRAKLTGIHAGIWDELSGRYKEYVNELGERYLR